MVENNPGNSQPLEPQPSPELSEQMGGLFNHLAGRVAEGGTEGLANALNEFLQANGSRLEPAVAQGIANLMVSCRRANGRELERVKNTKQPLSRASDAITWVNSEFQRIGAIDNQSALSDITLELSRAQTLLDQAVTNHQLEAAAILAAEPGEQY